MTWVKVCGLTEDAHVAAAVEAGADAVGFTLVPESPRAVDADRAAWLAEGVPIERILLTVGMDPEEALRLLAFVEATGIQPYRDDGGEVAAAAAAAGYRVLLPVAAGSEVPAPADNQIPLIDQRSKGRLGGTGETFDWSMVSDLDLDFVLAGGLGPDNVAAAIRQVAPWGVDASSGLESSRGVKDVARIAAFVEEAKQR